MNPTYEGTFLKHPKCISEMLRFGVYTYSPRLGAPSATVEGTELTSEETPSWTQVVRLVAEAHLRDDRRQNGGGLILSTRKRVKLDATER